MGYICAWPNYINSGPIFRLSVRDVKRRRELYCRCCESVTSLGNSGPKHCILTLQPRSLTPKLLLASICEEGEVSPHCYYILRNRVVTQGTQAAYSAARRNKVNHLYSEEQRRDKCLCPPHPGSEKKNNQPKHSQLCRQMKRENRESSGVQWMRAALDSLTLGTLRGILWNSICWQSETSGWPVNQRLGLNYMLQEVIFCLSERICSCLNATLLFIKRRRHRPWTMHR